MKRRTFLKHSLVTSAGIALNPLLPKLLAQSPVQPGQATPNPKLDGLLEKGFLHPPSSSRPHTYWMWMNGNITKKGITLDLEAMNQSGVGGAMIFNNAVGIPRGPVDFATDEWSDMVLHAATEAERLGLELTMHNSPGYSGAGGPWITPEMSMQELVWSESPAIAGGPIDIQLPKPYAKRGYYRNAFVLAYPALPIENVIMEDKVKKITINGVVVDKNKDSTVRYVHKRIGDMDMYFVANGQRREEELVCDFRLDGRQPEIWNSETGEISAAAVYEFKDGRTRMPLHFDPAESVFVFFRDPPQAKPYLSVSREGVKLIDTVKPSTEPQSPAPPRLQFAANGKIEALIWQDGDYRFQSAEKTASIKVENTCRAIPVSGPWKVLFPERRGAPPEIHLDALESLSKNSVFGVRHFSGTMTYEKIFSLHINPIDGQRVFLDLGRVEVIAEVILNGKDLGILWKAPFRIDTTKALRDGENDLTIKVTNLWPNRLIGDEYFPAEDEYVPLGAIVKLPEWFVKDLPRPGPRIAFSTWRHYTKDDPLPESGLMGPVKLYTAVQKTVE